MKNKKKGNALLSSLLIVAGLLLVFNQIALLTFGGNSFMNSDSTLKSSSSTLLDADLSQVDISKIKSTAQSVAEVFPIEKIKTSEDALKIVFPTGTPEYGDAMGVSFDKPIEALSYLSRSYSSLRAEVEANNPERFNRFLKMASMPIGISCEYCCGVGPVGIDKRGNSVCGCQHNPAILYVALWLTANTEYSDAQILRESLRWKTLFFPKDMIGLATNLANGEANIEELPGMVGGC